MLGSSVWASLTSSQSVANAIPFLDPSLLSPVIDNGASGVLVNFGYTKSTAVNGAGGLHVGVFGDFTGTDSLNLGGEGTSYVPIANQSAVVGGIAGWMLKSSRGTRYLPTIVLTGDTIGEFVGCGLLGAASPLAYKKLGGIEVVVSGVSATDPGGDLVFKTKPDAGVYREVARLTQAGVWQVNAVYPTTVMNMNPVAATAVEGDFFFETIQKKHASFSNGILGWMDRLLYSSYADVSLAGILAGQSLFSGTAKGTKTLPANWWKAGKTLKIRLRGYYSSDAAPGNFTLDVKVGATTFRTTGSIALNASITNGAWEIEGQITCQTEGAAGTLQGTLPFKHAATGATNLALLNEPYTAVIPVVVNTTLAAAFDIQWTATDAGTTIVCTNAELWEAC